MRGLQQIPLPGPSAPLCTPPLSYCSSVSSSARALSPGSALSWEEAGSLLVQVPLGPLAQRLPLPLLRAGTLTESTRWGPTGWASKLHHYTCYGTLVDNYPPMLSSRVKCGDYICPQGCGKE